MCYSHFAAAGVDVTVEDATNHGRVDLSVQIADRVYLMEIKVVESVSAGAAMAQLQARRYAEKYLRPGLSVWLVALEFRPRNAQHRRLRDQRHVTAPRCPKTDARTSGVGAS